jgi:hypothetical protein
MLTLILYLVVILVVAGFVVWLVESAPFISPSVKPVIRWVVLALCGLFAVVVLLQLFGVATPFGPVVVRGR